MSCPHGVWHEEDCEICTMQNEHYKQLASAKAEIDRLQAHNAMLVDVVISTQSDLVPHHTRAETYRAVHNVLSATPESPQQWLSEKLAQARKDALLDAADWFEGSPFQEALQIRDELQSKAHNQ